MGDIAHIVNADASLVSSLVFILGFTIVSGAARGELERLFQLAFRFRLWRRRRY